MPETGSRSGIEPILHDTQTRLAFRAEALLHTAVRAFRPTEAELRVFARGVALPRPGLVTSAVGVRGVLQNLDVASPPQTEQEAELVTLPAEALGGTFCFNAAYTRRRILPTSTHQRKPAFATAQTGTCNSICRCMSRRNFSLSRFCCSCSQDFRVDT